MHGAGSQQLHATIGISPYMPLHTAIFGILPCAQAGTRLHYMQLTKYRTKTTIEIHGIKIKANISPLILIP
jgi:hypothetical protein